ncbi:MAG TPA: hypothetical protein VMF90_22375, partial [Rhizobiaceae bacterium]|nr:hypothetical protein [Rhizobiaceae bacterium]
VRQLHAEVAGGAVVEEEEEQEPAEDGADEGEEENAEGSTTKFLSGLNKYIDLLEKHVDMPYLRKFLHRVKLVGRLGDLAQGAVSYAQFNIYRFRNYVKDRKDRIDNLSYSLFEMIIGKLPEGPQKVVFLLLLWVCLKVLGLFLVIFLILTRPSIILEKLGLDGEMLPYPE